MLSRALSLATVMLLIGGFAASPVQAENLEAGKSPAQIFAGTCNACHKSPRGLLKTVSSGSLPGFLREHYTTSSDMAKQLAGFLVSNGAGDTRIGAKDKDAKPAATPAKPETPTQQAARPEPNKPAGEGQAAIERGPDGRKLSAKQRLTKRGRPGDELPKELPKADAPKPEGEPIETKPEAPKETAKVESGTEEGSKLEASKPPGEPKPPAPSQSAKVELPKAEPPKVEATKSGETPALRPDPVPPVTPAPPTTSATIATGTPEPAPAVPAPDAPSSIPAQLMPAPPAASGTPATVTASTPPLPPVAPAGPPAPPISQ